MLCYFFLQPLDQGVIVALKLRYKRKLVAWTLEQYAKINNYEDLEGTQLDLLHCIVWAVAT